jgi:hypothetical protein|nr:hypothetical protein [Fusobacterium nucleatum]
MVTKKISVRDYLRGFIRKANKEAGVTFNAAKLNSKEECEEYLLNLIKDLRHKKQDNKAYIKEIDSLKEEIEILKNGNRSLESQEANFWKEDYFKEKDKHNLTKARLKARLEDYMVIVFELGVISIVEAISIAMLIWK